MSGVEGLKFRACGSGVFGLRLRASGCTGSVCISKRFKHPKKKVYCRMLINQSALIQEQVSETPAIYQGTALAEDLGFTSPTITSWMIDGPEE